jgi:hypothetical protein
MNESCLPEYKNQDSNSEIYNHQLHPGMNPLFHDWKLPLRMFSLAYHFYPLFSIMLLNSHANVLLKLYYSQLLPPVCIG